MKYIVGLFFTVFFCSFSFAQPAESLLLKQRSIEDSLKIILANSTNDTAKADLCSRIGWQYAWTIPDSALKYTSLGMEIADRTNIPEIKIDLLGASAQALSSKGNFSQALAKNFVGLGLSEKLRNNDLMAWSYASIGAIYFYAEDYSNALLYFLKPQKFPASYEARKRLYTGFIGETYFHLGNLDSALHYTQQSYDLGTSSDFHWGVPSLYMGKIYDKKGLYENALRFYHESIKQSVPGTDSVKALLALGNTFKHLNQLDSATWYARSAFSIAQGGSLYQYIPEISSLLKDVYKLSNQKDSALKYLELTLSAKDSLFNREKINQVQNLTYNEQQRQLDIIKEKETFRNKLKMYVLIGGLIFFLIFVLILLRSNRQKQKAKAKVEKAYTELKATQAQLIQSEKMASLGELTAGIAHEIQNPLNFVNNFSEVNKELIDEMKDEIDKGNLDEVKAIANDIKENEEKINHHGKRADAIVKGMLQHSRSSSGIKEPTDINALADEYLRLAYHGFRAKDKSFNATLKTDFDESIGNINIIPQDIGRVILNLSTMHFMQLHEKKKQSAEQDMNQLFQ